MHVNLEQSLEQIEDEYWGEAMYGSYLVTTCHQLRKKPLRDFTIEDLRIMIGQNISLDILMPLAFERLMQNIMAEGEFFPGDLLKNVLSTDRSYWLKHPVMYRRLVTLYKKNLPSIKKRVGESITKNTFKEIAECVETFRKINIS